MHRHHKYMIITALTNLMLHIDIFFIDSPLNTNVSINDDKMLTLLLVI